MDWRENKVVGILGGVVLVLSLLIIFIVVGKRVKPLPKAEKHSIERLPTGEEVPGPAIGIGK